MVNSWLIKVRAIEVRMRDRSGSVCVCVSMCKKWRMGGIHDHIHLMVVLTVIYSIQQKSSVGNAYITMNISQIHAHKYACSWMCVCVDLEFYRQTYICMTAKFRYASEHTHIPIMISSKKKTQDRISFARAPHKTKTVYLLRCYEYVVSNVCGFLEPPPPSRCYHTYPI